MPNTLDRIVGWFTRPTPVDIDGQIASAQLKEEARREAMAIDDDNVEFLQEWSPERRPRLERDNGDDAEWDNYETVRGHLERNGAPDAVFEALDDLYITVTALNDDYALLGRQHEELRTAATAVQTERDDLVRTQRWPVSVRGDLNVEDRTFHFTDISRVLTPADRVASLVSDETREELRAMEPTAEANAELFAALSDPEMEQDAIDAINDFTRTRMREDGFFRRILPDLDGTLDRAVDTDVPVHIAEQGEKAIRTWRRENPTNNRHSVTNIDAVPSSGGFTFEPIEMSIERVDTRSSEPIEFEAPEIVLRAGGTVIRINAAGIEFDYGATRVYHHNPHADELPPSEPPIENRQPRGMRMRAR